MPHLPRKSPEAEAFIFNHDYPIVSAQKYKNGLKLVRKSTTEFGKQSGGKRRKVEKLSSQSLKRLAFLVTTSHVEFVSIITLTYGQVQPTNGIISKGHLDNFLRAMRRDFGSFSYVWFLEFQKRGAPHYHILTTLSDCGSESRKKLARNWLRSQVELYSQNTNLSLSRMVKEMSKVERVHSHQRSWEEIRKRDGAKFYVIKYASKKEQKTVPKHFQDVGRFWGNSRDVPAKDFQEVDVTEEEVRLYLAEKGLSVANQLILPKLIIDLK